MNDAVRVRIYPSPYPEAHFIVSAVARTPRICQRCGYSWMSRFAVTITDEELRKNGLRPADVQSGGHPLVKLKKKTAHDGVVDFHSKPMLDCSKCEGK